MGGIRLRTRNELEAGVKSEGIVGIIPAAHHLLKMQNSSKLAFITQVCRFGVDSHCCKTILSTKETP
jgi:hypothetical protein